MKAVIIAAGMGSRMKALTKDKPKCMLDFNGKTLLEHQIDALGAAGVEKIALIKGYKKEKINYPDITYYINDNYENNNILHSLFYAEEEMSDEFIAVYSDIFYNQDVVKSLIAARGDISIVVDIDWRTYYQGRTDHPVEEAENVTFDVNNNLLKIGKIFSDKNSVDGEFIGMMKCSKKGAQLFKKHFYKLKETYKDKPFQKATKFEKAYLTDMLQDLADSGVCINCVTIKNGSREIDTNQDYQRLVKEFTLKNS